MIKNPHDLNKLRQNGLTVLSYLETLDGEDGEKIEENMRNYNPNKKVLDLLEEKAKGYTIVIFSASWCKDCKTNIATFAKILEEKPNIDAIIFTGIKTAPLDPNVKWKVPPSPEEVNEFNLQKIPTFFILDSEGREVGEIVENPSHKATLEEELLYILETAQ